MGPGTSRRRIAVIGAGGAGLTAAYVLQRAADVTLYESDDRLGGHAQTHEIPDGAGTSQVDSGFIVQNQRTYPTLLRLFRELGVAAQESDMSMSIRCGGCGLAYAGGRGLSGLVPTGGPVARFVRMLGQVVRFHRAAHRLLATPTPDESQLLGAIGYTRNPATLHTDGSVLPPIRRTQASWNYRLPTCQARPDAVQVSYNMNRLQRLHSDRQYVVTLNGDDEVDERSVLARMVYEHPVYDARSVAARTRLPQLNDGRIAFAGAYQGWGFHEDACRSGVAAAASLGVIW